MHFYYFSAHFFLQTPSIVKFLKPPLLYQPCGPTSEVLGLLTSSLLLCLSTKSAQNLEKCSFLIVFGSFFCLSSVNSNSDNHVNCTSDLDLNLRFSATTDYSASLLDNKKGSKPRKKCIFICFPLIFNILKF